MPDALLASLRARGTPKHVLATCAVFVKRSRFAARMFEEHRGLRAICCAHAGIPTPSCGAVRSVRWVVTALTWLAFSFPRGRVSSHDLSSSKLAGLRFAAQYPRRAPVIRDCYGSRTLPGNQLRSCKGCERELLDVPLARAPIATSCRIRALGQAGHCCLI